MSVPDGRLAAALALVRAGELARARRLLEALAASDDPGPAVLNALGALRYDAGEHESARAALERCVLLEPDHPLAHATLGELALRRHDLAAAARHFGFTLRARRPGLENVQRWVKALWASASREPAAAAATRPGCAR